MLFITTPACFIARKADSTDKDSESYERDYSKPYTPTIDDSLFEQAWLMDESTPNFIDSIFDRWEAEIRPISAKELQELNDTVRAIYEFFYDFYVLDSQFRKPKFVVLQNTLEYAVCDSEVYVALHTSHSGEQYKPQPEIAWEELKDFRPGIRAKDVRILYLSEACTRTLNYFFNEQNGHYPCLDYQIDATDWYILRSKEELLAKKIPLAPQHWCIGFHYYSFPHLNNLVFFKDLRRVKIVTRDGFNSGRYLEYQHTDTGWTEVPSHSSLMWIE
jgi:hypothetical protein